MTNEKLIEEILYIAHENGVMSELFDKVDNLKNINKIPFYDAIPIAFNELKSTGCIYLEE